MTKSSCKLENESYKICICLNKYSNKSLSYRSLPLVLYQLVKQNKTDPFRVHKDLLEGDSCVKLDESEGKGLLCLEESYRDVSYKQKLFDILILEKGFFI